jgi:nitrogen fixation/metabolism regulation signal transduction histidine kinase
LLNLTGGLLARDVAGRITIANPAAISLLHLPAGPLVGKPAAEVLREVPWFVQTMEDTLASRTTVSRQETTLPVQGQTMRLGYTTILIADPDKQVLGSGVIFQRLSS